MRVCANSPLFVRLPTAQTSFAELAATPYGAFSPAVPGLGLGTIVQLVPFQCRIKVVWSGPPLVALPTAQTFEEEMASTPLRMLIRFPVLGLGTMLQLVPFQCSINVRFSMPKA